MNSRNTASGKDQQKHQTPMTARPFFRGEGTNRNRDDKQQCSVKIRGLEYYLNLPIPLKPPRQPILGPHSVAKRTKGEPNPDMPYLTSVSVSSRACGVRAIDNLDRRWLRRRLWRRLWRRLIFQLDFFDLRFRHFRPRRFAETSWRN